MRAESLFLVEILKLKRRIFITSLLRIILRACLIFMFACLVMLLLEKAGISQYRPDAAAYIVLVGITLFVGFLYAHAKKTKFLDFLIDIDTRLNLQDRISTAYEYQSSENKSGLSDLLMQDAVDKLRKLSNKQMFPAKFSVLHLVLLLLVIANVALYSSIHFTSGFKSVPIEKARTLLRDYTMSRIERNQTQKTKPNDSYLKKLEQLTQTFNDRSKSQEQLFAALNKFIKEIHGEQTRLESELGTKLNAARIDEMSIENSVGLENLTSRNLEKLKVLLKQLLNNKIPDAIDRNIETLQELYSMEELLSQIIDDFSAGNSDKKAFADSGGDDTRASQPIDDDPQGYDDTKRAQTPGEFTGIKQGRKGADGKSGSDRSQGKDRGENDEIGNGEGYSISAGRAKSSGQKKPGHELGKAEGPGIKDKMISSQVNHYLMHIRSRGAIDESRLKEDNILRTYQQEVEGILQKENIPLNYREYIKQYFISIGLKAQEK